MTRWCARIAVWTGLSLLVLVATAHAAGWLETRVKGHRALVQVERDGRAMVEHELTLGVRGGPLKSFELVGVDADAAIEADATVVPIVRYGVPAPIPLALLRNEDGSLRIDVEHPKGLRTGTYVFRFRYATNLRARDKVRLRGTSAEIEWVGPRFADGVDVAKVVFRVPAGPVPPALPIPDDGDEAQLLGSAFLSQLRHDGDKVEVELVRPHLAKGEPAVWRLLVSPKIFDGLDQPARAARAAIAPPPVVERPAERLFGVLAALLGASGYALLVLLKWTLVRRDCRALRAAPHALVKLPIGLRAALAGASAAAAGVLGVMGDYPTLASVVLLAAVALATTAAPRPLLSPRGAGHWLPLKDEDAFGGVATPRAGRFLDFGTLPGGLLALSALATIALGVAWLLPRSPYHALCLALGSLLLVPLFATGRGVHLPGQRNERARLALPSVAKKLRARGLRVCAFGRIASQGRAANGVEAEPDELRLLVRPVRPRDGLLGLEIGIEQQPTIGGFLQLPFVLVRVRDGSPAQRSLGRHVIWQRGRGAEERVAIVRPGLPSRGLLIELVSELVNQLSDESRPPSRRARNSAGTSVLTSKFRAASPAHAT
jgi:hypothetical protein